MALKKKKDEDEDAAMKERQNSCAASVTVLQPKSEAPQHPRTSGQGPVAVTDLDKVISDERGRRIDKGKAKVRVVGFDGSNQDTFDEPE